MEGGIPSSLAQQSGRGSSWGERDGTGRGTIPGNKRGAHIPSGLAGLGSGAPPAERNQTDEHPPPSAINEDQAPPLPAPPSLEIVQADHQERSCWTGSAAKERGTPGLCASTCQPRHQAHWPAQEKSSLGTITKANVAAG